MEIRGQGLVGEDGQGQGSSAAAEQTVYVMHPNCAVEEY
jgi:DNA replication licensing factor MCM6